MSQVNYALSEDGITTLTLNRDDKRNAIDGAMAGQLLQGLEQAQSQAARAVVLRANPGVGVWCAGHDVAELDPQSLESENMTLEVCRRIQSSPLPVIAMVEGSVHAGGLILLLSADIVVATDSASVIFPANKIGIPLAPHWYALWLRVMGLHRAKELLLTAAPMSAADAHAAGLYNHVVDAAALEATTYEIAGRIAACVPEVIANTNAPTQLARHVFGAERRRPGRHTTAQRGDSRQSTDKTANRGTAGVATAMTLGGRRSRGAMPHSRTAARQAPRPSVLTRARLCRYRAPQPTLRAVWLHENVCNFR